MPAAGVRPGGRTGIWLIRLKVLGGCGFSRFHRPAKCAKYGTVDIIRFLAIAYGSGHRLKSLQSPLVRGVGDDPRVELEPHRSACGGDAVCVAACACAGSPAQGPAGARARTVRNSARPPL